jgi:hypothetical protein
MHAGGRTDLGAQTLPYVLCKKTAARILSSYTADYNRAFDPDPQTPPRKCIARNFTKCFTMGISQMNHEFREFRKFTRTEDKNALLS